MESFSQWIGVVASPALLTAVIWLAKYTLEKEKKTEKAIQEVTHKVTLVVNDNTKDLLILEINNLKTTIDELKKHIAELQAEKVFVNKQLPELIDGLMKESIRNKELWVTYHEICGRFHQKIQILLINQKHTDQQFKEINLKLATIKRL